MKKRPVYLLILGLAMFIGVPGKADKVGDFLEWRWHNSSQVPSTQEIQAYKEFLSSPRKVFRQPGNGFSDNIQGRIFGRTDDVQGIWGVLHHFRIYDEDLINYASKWSKTSTFPLYRKMLDMPIPSPGWMPFFDRVRIEAISYLGDSGTNSENVHKVLAKSLSGGFWNGHETNSEALKALRKLNPMDALVLKKMNRATLKFCSEELSHPTK